MIPCRMNLKFHLGIQLKVTILPHLSRLARKDFACKLRESRHAEVHTYHTQNTGDNFVHARITHRVLFHVPICRVSPIQEPLLLTAMP